MADSMSHEAPSREPQTLPVMLPGKLVGRDVILARVYAQLKENKPVLVFGTPGIGKTALAATLASAYTELPGGVLWINVEHATFPELLAQVGRAYGVAELTTTDNPASLVGAAAATLSQNKPLIVVDGKPDAQALTDFITRCADRLPVLIASDDELAGPWTSLRLGKLEPEQSATLYRQIADPQAGLDGLNALMAALDHTPFAIAIAAGVTHLKQQTPADFLASLPQQAGAGANAQLLALTSAFRMLNSALQGLLLVMGATLRGEASAELVSLIANAPVDAIQGAMNLLAQYHLIERFDRYDKPYYRLHPITHLFAQSWLKGSGRLDNLQTKFNDAVLAYTKKHSAAGQAGHNNLAAEMSNIVATARKASESGDRDTVNALIGALSAASDFVNARGYVYELLTLRRLSSSSTSAFPAHEETIAPVTPTIPPVTTPTAEAPESAEDTEEALDDEPVEDVDTDVIDGSGFLVGIDDEIEEVPLIEDEDELFEDEDEDIIDFIDDELDEEAVEDEDVIEDDDLDTLEDFDDELDDEEIDDEDVIDDELDDEAVEDEAEDDEVQPDLLIAADAPADPIGTLRTQVMEARQGGDRRRQADALVALGGEQAAQGKTTEAISTYSEALALYEAATYSAGRLTTLEALADLTARTDNSEAAVLHASRGAQLAHQLENDTSETHFLMTLGDAHQQLGESDAAIRDYSQALDLARANNDGNEAVVLYKLGYAQLDSGDAEEAIDTWEEALTLFREQNRRNYEGRVLGGLGAAFGELGRWQEAISYHTSALHIAREVADRDEEALQLTYLGYASVQARQLGQAVLRYRQALHLAYSSGSREAIVSTSADLARLLMESPRHLDIAELLIDAALQVDPNDRDLRRLKEQIAEKRAATGGQQTAVTGTAQQYAANAYALLDG